MDSVRPYKNYEGGIVPQAELNGTIGIVVYASNYNDLNNKPSINSVELRGNKTAEDLGLATPEDIKVTSVNNQTGDVDLTGQNIPYDENFSLNEKINDLESQITDSGVSSVNGQTGVVTLTGTDINYSAGVSVNAKIDAVEGEIPVVDYPVTSVNNQTGDVDLTGDDIEYSAGVTINEQIDNVAGEISDLTGADISLTSEDSTKVSTAIGTLSALTTRDKSSIVGAVNEVNGKLPTWVTQASGTSSGTIAGASVFGYYYADQWQAYIYLPFVTKNTNYTVNITAVSADNVGDVTSKCSVVAKQNGYFTVRTTKTMANLPDYYSVCPMRITYSIDFA